MQAAKGSSGAAVIGDKFQVWEATSTGPLPGAPHTAVRHSQAPPTRAVLFHSHFLFLPCLSYMLHIGDNMRSKCGGVGTHFRTQFYT
jgi:hypothetical protein